MQTEKIAGRFDCKVYNPKLPKEQWKLAADDGNVVLTVTYPLAKLPDMFKVNGQVDEFCKFYASRDEQRAAKEANRQPVADRIAVKFKVCANCKWFDATGTKMARPTNEALDGKPVMVMVDFARKAKDATNNLAPCGYWANAIMIKFEDECPFAGKEFEQADDPDDQPAPAEQEAPAAAPAATSAPAKGMPEEDDDLPF